MGEDIEVGEGVRIPLGELTYRATRAGGPGGQHVNTSATRIELTWDVAGSPSLTDEQRARLRERLASRMDQAGVLRVVSAVHRSQHRNREEATERLRRTVERALRPPRPRRATKVPRAQKEKRLRDKKQRSEVKRRRGRVRPEEG